MTSGQPRRKSRKFWWKKNRMLSAFPSCMAIGGAVLLSGIAGLGIAFFATGGIIPALGFGGLAILWLYTTSNAYTSIKKIDIDAHQRWMIRSYALCFAAVTLRLYLPLFTGLMHMDFIPAYKIIAWLCWVPNILIAEIFIVRRLT